MGIQTEKAQWTEEQRRRPQRVRVTHLCARAHTHNRTLTDKTERRWRWKFSLGVLLQEPTLLET